MRIRYTPWALLPLALFMAGQSGASAQTSAGSGQTAKSSDTQKDASKDATTEVTVNGKTPASSDRIDRRIYDIKNDPDAQTGVAADVLNKLPSVQVTPAGSVTLRGDGNVSIMIDGKYPANGNAAIQTLSAADIDRIEVMTNPPAQYAPDGTAGIINIITKKRHPVGWHGNVNIRANSLGQINFGPSANFTYGRWSVDARLSTTQFPYHGSAVSTRTAPAQVDGGYSYEGNSENNLGNLNIAYKLTDKSTLTLETQTFRSVSKTTDASTYRSDTLNFDTDSGNTFTLNQSDLEGVYEYRDDATGQHFTLDYDHTDMGQTQRLSNNDTYADGAQAVFGQHTTNKFPEDNLKGDYERHYDDGDELTAGFQIDRQDSRFETNYNSSGQVAGPVPDGYDHAFDVARTVSSAYVTYQHVFGVWTVLPGLRAEWERRLVTSADYRGSVSDIRWYPSLHVERKLDDEHKLRFSYSRRVQRPDLQAYDPGATSIGTTSENIGNPYLQPTDTDAYEAEYSYHHKDLSYAATLFYRQNSDLISYITTAQTDNYLVTRPQNTGTSHSSGAEFTLKTPLGMGWKASINANLSDEQLERVGYGQRDYLRGNGNVQVEYSTKGGDLYQTNLTLSSRSYTAQGYTNGNYRLDLSYQHPINKKLTLVLSVTDLTNSQGFTTVIDTPDLKSRETHKSNDQSMKIGLAWKFGTK